MKPLSLRFQNFGPYSGPAIEIDFARLDQLFLICGDTGAGKTTLFDAMSYALYGAPLGTRGTDTLRSQFAEEEASTWVTFTFATFGEVFQVTRSPHWVERAARGDKFKQPTTHLTALRLRGEDWEPICASGNATDINPMLAKAVGFTHDEFSKLVVLPQGQFQQFLEMKSADREALLKLLFPVEDHEQLARLAKERAAELAEASKALDGAEQEVRRTYDPDQAEATRARLGNEVEQARSSAEQADRAFDLAAAELVTGQDLDRRFTQRETLRAQQAGLHAQAADRERDRSRLKAHQRALRALPDVAALEQARASLEQAGRDLEARAAAEEATRRRQAEAQAEAGNLAEARTALQNRREALQAQERIQGRLKELVDLDRQVLRLRKTAEEAEVEAGGAEAALQRQAADLEAQVQSVAGLSTLRQRMDEVRGQGEELAAALEGDTKKALHLRGQDIPTAEQALALAQDTVARAEAEEATSVESLGALEAARNRAQAAALAEGLREDAPCPVCGSLNHPHPAEAAEMPGQSRLEAARQGLERAREHVGTARELRAERQAKLDAQRQQLQDFLNAMANRGFDGPEAVEARLKELRAIYRGIRDEAKPLEEVEARLPALRKDLESVRASVDRLREAARSGAGEVEKAAALRARIAVEAGDPEAPEVQAAALALALQEAKGALEADARQVDQQDHALREAEKALSSAASARQQKASDRDGLEVQVQALEPKAAAALAAAGFGDAGALRAARLPDPEAQALERLISDFDQVLARTQGALEPLEAALEGCVAPDLARLQAGEAETRVAREIAQAALGRLRMERDALEASAARWADLQAQRAQLKARGEAFVELADDLNGAGKHKREKLSFSSFVLGRWLSRVLDEASHRLHRLSSGRYRFVHQDAAEDRRNKAGLEIDVFDAHSGGVRSVRSLSGGEKFWASLALALGLSDVIQAAAGGRRLEALFIDEGFGSLDGESLDRAIEVLKDVGEGRQVGIISHVEGLRSSIESQIRVEKGSAGSRLKVV